MPAPKKRGLGRGLSELGLEELLPTAERTSAELSATMELPTVSQLPLDALMPGRFQPRQQMAEEALQDLAASIKSQGVLQPILVRKITDKQYEIIAGERRWRASRLAGLTNVPVIIKTISDESALAVSLIENIQRQDLNALEEAQALQRLIQEFQLTHEEVAQAVGKSRVSVTNALRLLHLSMEIQTLLMQGLLEMGHARALLGLSPQEQSNVAKRIVAEEWSVRQAEEFIRKMQQEAATKPDVRLKPKADPDVSKLQMELGDRLGAVVKIQHGAQGRGRLLILYNSVEELDNILEHIQ